MAYPVPNLSGFRLQSSPGPVPTGHDEAADASPIVKFGAPPLPLPALPRISVPKQSEPIYDDNLTPLLIMSGYALAARDTAAHPNLYPGSRGIEPGGLRPPPRASLHPVPHDWPEPALLRGVGTTPVASPIETISLPALSSQAGARQQYPERGYDGLPERVHPPHRPPQQPMTKEFNMRSRDRERNDLGRTVILPARGAVNEEMEDDALATLPSQNGRKARRRTAAQQRQRFPENEWANEWSDHDGGGGGGDEIDGGGAVSASSDAEAELSSTGWRAHRGAATRTSARAGSKRARATLPAAPVAFFGVKVNKDGGMFSSPPSPWEPTACYSKLNDILAPSLLTVRTRGKLEMWERDQVDTFVHDVIEGRRKVMRGDLAKELREFVNPQVRKDSWCPVLLHAHSTRWFLVKRPLNFFEKLVSRRKLNIELAGLLVDRLGPQLGSAEGNVGEEEAVDSAGRGGAVRQKASTSRAPSSQDADADDYGFDCAVPFDFDESSAVDIAVAAMTALSPPPISSPPTPISGGKSSVVQAQTATASRKGVWSWSSAGNRNLNVPGDETPAAPAETATAPAKAAPSTSVSSAAPTGAVTSSVGAPSVVGGDGLDSV